MARRVIVHVHSGFKVGDAKTKAEYLAEIRELERREEEAYQASKSAKTEAEKKRYIALSDRLTDQIEAVADRARAAGITLDRVTADGWTVVAKVGEYQILEGSGPHAGKWAVFGRNDTKVFNSRSEAEKYAKSPTQDAPPRDLMTLRRENKRLRDEFSKLAAAGKGDTPEGAKLRRDIDKVMAELAQQGAHDAAPPTNTIRANPRPLLIIENNKGEVIWTSKTNSSGKGTPAPKYPVKDVGYRELLGKVDFSLYPTEALIEAMHEAHAVAMTSRTQMGIAASAVRKRIEREIERRRAGGAK